MDDSQRLLDLADRLEKSWNSRSFARLKPETALVLAIAARAYATHPSRDDVARALCSTKGGCAKLCINCIGHANVVQRVYTARQGPR